MANVGRPTGWALARIGVTRSAAWPAALVLCALVLGQLPLLLSACCAPTGASGLGTVWFINDFAQYESAMRQGRDGPGWLIYDAFTTEPHRPALMFTLYVAVGKLAAFTHLPLEALERTLEIAARALFVLALWRFSQAFATDRGSARAALLLALLGSGFEVFAALLGSTYTGNWSYETNSLGLLFAAPHVPLAMAASLELARGWLRSRSRLTPLDIVAAAALGAAVAALHPFHAPVLLSAMLVTGVVFWRGRHGPSTLVGALAAACGALPLLWTTVQLFSFDAFWAATYSVQNLLPSPAPHELLVDLGPSLLLALWGAFALRARVAPFGLLMWLLFAAMAMYLPVPYQRRLSFGLQPALALVAANSLAWACGALRPSRAATLRLAVVATAASGTLLILSSVVSSALSGGPLPVYRSTTDLDAAAGWLGANAREGEVIMADWTVSNYLAPRTPARVIGGHPVATLDASDKQMMIAIAFSHQASAAVARQFGAHWLVYTPAQHHLPGLSAAFQSGEVRVFRLAP